MPPAYARTSLVLTSLLFAANAGANGAFPEVSQLVADPALATHLVLRSNFGLLTTEDSGQTWDLVCEGGIGYQNIEPPIALLDDGSTIAALATGIAHGDPSACNFGVASGVDTYVADVSRVPSLPGHAVAVSVDIAGNTSQIWQSADDGATWTTFGTSIANLNAATLDVTADDPNTVYVSGTAQSDTLSGVLARSSDGGQTWTRYDVPGVNKVSAPYIAAISPSDDAVVYVRLSGTPGHLLVTRDGGAHFDDILDFTGPFDGFALSPDGQSVLASGRVDGVWRAPTASLTFEQLSCAKLRCLSWTASGLFACADEFEAGFLVGQSTDEGLSFEPLLHLSCLRGPLACPSSTSVGAVCPAAWPAISQQLGTDCASASSFMPSTICRDAGSASDAATAQPDSSTPNDSGSAAAGEPPISTSAATLTPRGGCGCVAAGAGALPSVWLSLLSLGLCWFGHSFRRSRHARRC